MFLCRTCSRALLAWAPIVLLSILGCESVPGDIEAPRRKDDFGTSLSTQEINAETVGETQMLHRRTQLEVKGMAVIPTGFFASNNFEVGGGIGIKGDIETSKDFFIGLSLDYAHLTQGKGVSDLPPTGLAGVEPDQLFESLDRYNFLVTGDYDLTLTKSFLKEKSPLKLRLGGGIGATLVDPEIDSFLRDQVKASGSDVKRVPYVGFLARFAAGLRWQFHEQMMVFTEVMYDFVAPFEAEIEVNGTRSTIDGDIDFGSINLTAGIAFEF